MFFSKLNFKFKVDGSGTVAATDRLEKLKETSDSPENSVSETVEDAAPINENLFLDEDLDCLDDELNELNLDDGLEDLDDELNALDKENKN